MDSNEKIQLYKELFLQMCLQSVNIADANAHDNLNNKLRNIDKNALHCVNYLADGVDQFTGERDE